MEDQDKTSLEDEFVVLNIFQGCFACPPNTETTDFKFIEEPMIRIVPFIAEVCMIAGITDNDEVEVRIQAKFISAQSTDANRRSTFVSLGKPNTHFNVDNDGVLVRAFPLHGALQRAEAAFLLSCYFHNRHYTFLTGHSG